MGGAAEAATEQALAKEAAAAEALEQTSLTFAKKSDVKFIDYLQKKYKFGNDSRELLHEMITKQNLSKKKIEELAKDLNDGK